MIEQSLLKLLLSREFYLSNRDRLSENFFDGNLKDVYKTILVAQEKYQHDLTLEEVQGLHNAASPTLSRAAKNQLSELFFDLEALEDLSPDVGEDILAALWKKETFRELAEMAIKGVEGQEADLESIRKLVDARSDSFIPDVNVDYVTNDLDELLEITNREAAWKINIPSVAEKLPGLSGGEFMIIAARPESGKTAAYVSLTCAKDGWAWQGARVLIVTNEEPGRRTRLRCVTAACGEDEDWVRANVVEARKRYNAIRDNVILVDAVGLSMAGLSNLVRKVQPDITIVDQADKISVKGSYSASHEKIREVYIQLREIAKKNNCFMLGISQASAEAEGKSVINFAMLEGSKTGKAAEADVVCTIGRFPQTDMAEEDFSRIWNFPKNQISGFHGNVITILDPKISTYRS